MPAILKILLVFAGVLILNRLKLQLGLALLAGGIGLSFMAGMTPTLTAQSLWKACTGSELWIFVVIMCFIIELGRYLGVKKNADEIVGLAQRWGGRWGRAATIMMMPVVIGLVPMPGGAIVSAPFVQQATGNDDPGLSDWKASVNYWFRHVLEYWWPLYPGVIIAMSVFGMQPRQFIATDFLYTPLALLTGYFILVRPQMKSLSEPLAALGGSNRRALILLTPIAAVVLSLFVMPEPLRFLCPSASVQTRNFLVLTSGLGMATIVILVDELLTGGIRGVGLFSTLKKRQSLEILASIMGVMVFKSMMESSGLLGVASREMVGSGIPVSLAVAGLPFLAGFVTGVALGFSGTSFPMVVGLMNAEGSGLTPMATLVLAYGFGFSGMMLSPVHLCALVTRDYFGGSLPRIYRRVLPCVLLTLLLAVILHRVYLALGW